MPFTSPEWLLAWWQHLGGGSLRVLTLRAETRLVAILPLFIYVDGGLRHLLPVGISASDRFDLVAEPTWSRFASDAFATVLEARDEGWDACQLHEIPEHSPMIRYARSRTLQSVSPTLDLRRFILLPTRCGARRRLHRARRKATLAGLRFDQPGPEELETLFALHEKQWRARGESGVLAHAKIQAFHRAAARGLANAGVLRMHRVQQNGRCLGLLYGFLSGDRAYAYLSGIDPDGAKLELGTLLIGEAIDQAVREGASAFDFLRGAEPYKYAWGAVDERLFRLEFTPPPRAAAPPTVPSQRFDHGVIDIRSGELP